MARGKGDSLKLELSKLRVSLDELLEEKKKLRVKMRVNRINIQDILTDNKLIEKELEETETKLSMIAQNMSEIVAADEENNDCDDSEGFVFDNERPDSLQEHPDEKEDLIIEVVLPDTTNNGSKITAVALPDFKEVTEVRPPLTMITQVSKSVTKETTGKVKQVTIGNVNLAENFENKSSEKSKEKIMESGRAVILNETKLMSAGVKEVETNVTKITRDMTDLKSTKIRTDLKGKSIQQLTGRIPGVPRKQFAVQRPSAIVESMLNKSVIDCGYVMKKSILKEKQVIKTKILKTEAHPPNLFACNYCSKSFTSAAPLAAHLANHTIGDVMDCPFPMCTWHSSDQQKLTQHMRSKHTKEQLFNCYSCEAKFSTFNAKTAHERNHTDQRLEQCGRCQKFYQMSKNCRCSAKKPH